MERSGYERGGIPLGKLWEGGCFWSSSDELQASNVRLRPHHYFCWLLWSEVCKSLFGRCRIFVSVSAAWLFTTFTTAWVFLSKRRTAFSLFEFWEDRDIICFGLEQTGISLKFPNLSADVFLPYTSISPQSCFCSALGFQTSPRCSALIFPSLTYSGRSWQPVKFEQ